MCWAVLRTERDGCAVMHRAAGPADIRTARFSWGGSTCFYPDLSGSERRSRYGMSGRAPSRNASGGPVSEFVERGGERALTGADQ